MAERSLPAKKTHSSDWLECLALRAVLDAVSGSLIITSSFSEFVKVTHASLKAVGLCAGGIKSWLHSLLMTKLLWTVPLYKMIR